MSTEKIGAWKVVSRRGEGVAKAIAVRRCARFMRRVDARPIPGSSVVEVFDDDLRDRRVAFATFQITRRGAA